MQFWMYRLTCADGSYYCGHTDNLEVRIAAHQDGSFGGYTASGRPVVLSYAEVFERRDDAFRREQQVKGWSRAKKAALVRQDRKDVQRLARSAHPSSRSG